MGRVLHLLRALGDHRLQAAQVGLVLQLEPAAPDRVYDGQIELGRADGLDEVGMRAVLHGGLAQLRVVDPRDHHYGDVRLERAELAEKPIARFVGQAHVQQDDAVLRLCHPLPGLGAGERRVGFDVPALQDARHRAGQGFLVLDYQGPGTVLCGRHTQSLRRTLGLPSVVGCRSVSLDVQTRQTEAGVTVVVPSGRLDVAGAPALKEAIGDAVKNGPPRLVIDLEGVSFVDSTGLGSVIAALKLVRGSRGDLRLAAPNQQVRVVLELTTLDRVFAYYPTVEDALTDF